METEVKIKSSLNRMKKEFETSASKYYYIKYYRSSDDIFHMNAEELLKNCNKKYDDNKPIIFTCLIRHNEIGNETIANSKPYTFETLEKTLKEKCEQYENELLEKNNGNCEDCNYEL